MKNFKDKVVVITGGATGIGFGFAEAFGAEGAKIILAARREERLKEAVSTLQTQNVEATYFVCDVSEPQQIEALADFAWAWKGHVDVIVNNAGMMVSPASVLEMPMEHIESIFKVNFFSVVHGSKIFGKRFVDQGTAAAIYNIGSENSLFHGTPFNGAYVATKHGVYAMTQSLYEELPDFISVSLVCPGFVMSELGPKENMSLGMPTKQFIDIAMLQLKEERFFVISHAYNMERLSQKHKMLSEAYAKYAPRYEGDEQYDVRKVASGVLEQLCGQKIKPLFDD